MELRKMNADVIERHETIVSATERRKKMLLRDYPAWPQEFRRLALGALAMYKTRLTDIYTREYVQLLHVVLGGDFLHAHDKSTAYFWNDEIGFVDRFDGLLPEIIYGELKQYLLRLEGLFRSFVGEVRRDDDALLTAIQAVYERHGSDASKAFALFRDNAILTASPSTKWQGKGRGREGKGSEDPDADAPEAEPNEPWYIYQAKCIAKTGHNLQVQLLGNKLIPFYIEWCSTPKPSVKGVAHPDIAFLYDVDDQTPCKRATPEERKMIYVGIPHKLKPELDDPVLRAATKRVQAFYTQTFWANQEAYHCCLAALALAKRGLNVDNVFLFWGSGGVGLSLTTTHLDAMLGPSNHKYFDPQMFYLDEELRKQIEILAGAIVLTAQEKPEGMRKAFREDLFKKVASADPLFGRLPYQILTKIVCATGWVRMEMNKLISFGNISEAAFHSIFRRCLVIKIAARFVDPDFVEVHVPDAHRYGIYPRQCDLKDFLRSGPAIAAGLLIQAAFERKANEHACRDVINGYVLRDGDCGLTEKTIRQACGLPPKAKSKRSDNQEHGGTALPKGVHFDLSQDVEQNDEEAPLVGSLSRHVIQFMIAKGLDQITATYFNQCGIPSHFLTDKKSELWEQLISSDRWSKARMRGRAQKNDGYHR